MNQETAPRFAGIGGHHSHKSGTVEWYTPPEIIATIGPFDLDPCAPIVQPYPTARHVFTVEDNGLIQRWPPEWRVLLNPPYTAAVIGRWLARLAEHGNGTALIFARTDTEAFHRHVFQRATALLFMRGRINFRTAPLGLPAMRKDGKTPANAGAPTVLCAYGMKDADILASCEIDGQFIPLRIPRSVLVSMFERSTENATWAAVVRSFFDRHGDGPVALAELYRYVRDLPKAAGNRNPEAKVRQILQREGYERVDSGVWKRPQ